jgi:hypothetical protein
VLHHVEQGAHVLALEAADVIGRVFERSDEELKFMPGMLPMARTISIAMKLLWAA